MRATIEARLKLHRDALAVARRLRQTAEAKTLVATFAARVDECEALLAAAESAAPPAPQPERGE